MVSMLPSTLRNKDVWKATNRQTLEDHLVKDGIEFSKEAVDAAHAKYAGEIQASDEAKAKADAARKATENSSSTTMNPSENPSEYPSKSPSKWQFVATAIEIKYGVRLGALSREVYIAYKTSKGSEEALQVLIKQHAPHQTGPQNPQSTP
jgi:hypothetical protein